MIRIALIGCNAAADYGPAASRLQGAKFVAAVDPHGAAAEDAARALDASIRAASFKELIDRNAAALDAVMIRSTNDPPAEIVARAAAAGKHVMLDMPLILRMPSSDEPIDACRSAGVTFMLAQDTRFLPAVAEVKSCLNSGILGSPGLLRLHDWKPPGAEPTDGAAAILEDILPDVDLANWLFDALPTEVYAAGSAGPDRAQDAYGYVQAHLGFPNGGMALVDRSAMLPSGSDYFALSMFGSSGAAYADDHHNVHLLYGGGRPAALPAGQGCLHRVAELQEFVDAIEAHRRPAVAADDGCRAAEVTRAIGRSLESGRALQLVGSCYEFV